ASLEPWNTGIVRFPVGQVKGGLPGPPGDPRTLDRPLEGAALPRGPPGLTGGPPLGYLIDQSTRPMPPRTREALITTAARLFHEQGYGSTGIATILREADVNSGSLYHFFP